MALSNETSSLPIAESKGPAEMLSGQPIYRLFVTRLEATETACSIRSTARRVTQSNFSVSCSARLAKDGHFQPKDADGFLQERCLLGLRLSQRDRDLRPAKGNGDPGKSPTAPKVQ